MSVLDKFLDVMKLNDEDDFDEDFYDEDDDYYEEKPQRKKKFRSSDIDDDYDERPLKEERKPKSKSAKSNNSKIMPIRSSKRQGSGMEVCVIKPTQFEDSREITETLLDGRTVVLNLEGLDVNIAQRIIDFGSGACYAIGGNLQKISNYIFIVTPASVDITGDLEDILNGAFDMSTIHMDY